jgi:hypothetical protein
MLESNFRAFVTTPRAISFLGSKNYQRKLFIQVRLYTSSPFLSFLEIIWFFKNIFLNISFSG